VHRERYGAIRIGGYVEAKTLHRHIGLVDAHRDIELQGMRRWPVQLRVSNNNNNNNNNSNTVCYSLTS
jgi:hypothetical protein